MLTQQIGQTKLQALYEWKICLPNHKIQTAMSAISAEVYLFAFSSKSSLLREQKMSAAKLDKF